MLCRERFVEFSISKFLTVNLWKFEQQFKLQKFEPAALRPLADLCAQYYI
jgi:hypothetical protein